MSKNLIAAAFCFALVGCLKERRPRVDIQECEARLSDIPIHLNRRPIEKSISETSFAYFSLQSLKELSDYYLYEMERLGWDLIGQSKSDELLFVFRKPHKIAVISLRLNGRSVLVRIDISHQS